MIFAVSAPLHPKETMADILLEPIILGDNLHLRNRICMGSMTRNRCVDNSKPTEASVKHYVNRAQDGTGLIIAEGTFISPHGAEWPYAPVMYNQEHADAWSKVTSAVHEVGGKIFFQPWHPGRLNVCYKMSEGQVWRR